MNPNQVRLGNGSKSAPDSHVKSLSAHDTRPDVHPLANGPSYEMVFAIPLEPKGDFIAKHEPSLDLCFSQDEWHLFHMAWMDGRIAEGYLGYGRQLL